jgi:hypothetical protein
MHDGFCEHVFLGQNEGNSDKMNKLPMRYEKESFESFYYVTARAVKKSERP